MPTCALPSNCSLGNANISSHSAASHQVLEDLLYLLESLSPVDHCLISMYGDTVHLNDGIHTHEGIDDDKIWQDCWAKLMALPYQRTQVKQ
eukprot:5593039-Ditylum_brightwellii.AAC.1